MATTRKARTGRSTRRASASRRSGIGSTLRGYQGQATKLLGLPVTRFILGGAAVAALAPVVMNFFRREEVQSFISDNVEGIRSRIDGVIHSGETQYEALNQEN